MPDWNVELNKKDNRVQWKATAITEKPDGARRRGVIIRFDGEVVTPGLRAAVEHALDGAGKDPGNLWDAWPQGVLDFNGPAVISEIIDADDAEEEERWTALKRGGSKAGYLYLPHVAITDLIGNPIRDAFLEREIIAACKARKII